MVNYGSDIGSVHIVHDGVTLVPILDAADIARRYRETFADLRVRSGFTPLVYDPPETASTWNAEHMAIIAPNGDDVGFVQLSHNRAHRSASVGIVVLPRFQRRGYATRAYQALFRYAFEWLGLHRLTAAVYGYNEPSIALHERLMTREGCDREAIYWRGEYHDLVTYGILAREYLHGPRS
jgi:RimJ/RimL family protein N-acetyltransferase